MTFVRFVRFERLYNEQNCYKTTKLVFVLSHFLLNFKWPLGTSTVICRSVLARLCKGSVRESVCVGEGILNEVNRRGVIWIVGPLQTHSLDPPQSGQHPTTTYVAEGMAQSTKSCSGTTSC